MSFSNDQPLVANQFSDFDIPDNFDDFSEIFEREYKRVIDAVNTKEGGLYLLQELATFEQYFTPNDPQQNRNIYRKVIDFGSLPNTSSKSVAHNIAFNSNTRMTRLYGAASDSTGVQFIPLPFASPTLAESVSLSVTGTQVIITTGSDRTNFTSSTIVMEYSKG